MNRKYLLVDKYENMRQDIQIYTKYIFPCIEEINDLGILIKYFKIVFRDTENDDLTLINILNCDEISLTYDEFNYVYSVLSEFLLWFRGNYMS